jgi:hypothetical protein
MLAGVRNELKRINDDLTQKCNASYRLEISQYRYRDADAAVYDELSNEYDIILCLYHGPKCVSSVTGRYNQSKQSMELLSKTATEYEGLKFNLYLRSIFIYLMYFVRPSIQTIYSHSMNPISTYAMYKHYHASNSDLQEYTRDRGLTPETFTLADAQNFHTYFTEKYRQTPESARNELEEMLEEYSMEDLGWETEEEAIEFIITTMNVRAITLELELETPGTKEYLLNKLLTTQIKCDQTVLPPRNKKSRRNENGAESSSKRTRRRSNSPTKQMRSASGRFYSASLGESFNSYAQSRSKSPK